MKRFFLILVLSIAMVGCSDDDNNGTLDNGNPLAREWNLIFVSNGLAPYSNYEQGEIKWTFSQNQVNVTIAEETDINIALPFQENGVYAYVVDEDSIILGENSLGYEFMIEFDEELNKDILYIDGGSAYDGPRFTFVEN